MENQARWTLESLAKILGGTFEGPADLKLARPAPSHDGDLLGITFAENEKYLAEAEATTVGAVLISMDSRASTKPVIRVAVPRQAFFMLLAMSDRPMQLAAEIHPTAVISPEATLEEGVSVGPYAVIEKGAKVGKGARVFPFVYVGENCKVGENCMLLPHSVLYRDVSLGRGTVIHSGVVVGADGFGYVWDGTQRMKVPQVGRVEIGDNVEVGANTTIDRATAGATVIGNGTKIDNLVQIGHNCRIGEHSIFAGMCGISGSTTIGSRVVFGGGAGTNDHISVCDDVMIGGRSSLDGDIKEPGAYFGTPARPAREALRSFAVIPKLYDLLQRVRALEKKVGS